MYMYKHKIRHLQYKLFFFLTIFFFKLTDCQTDSVPSGDFVEMQNVIDFGNQNRAEPCKQTSFLGQNKLIFLVLGYQTACCHIGLYYCHIENEIKTVNKLLFASEIILQGLQEPCCQEYFSPCTSPCRMVVKNNTGLDVAYS